MTFVRGSLLIGAFMLVCSAFAAHAADLWRGGSSMKDGGYRPAITTNPTWYARLDTAYAAHDDPIMVEESRFDLYDRAWDSTWTLGGGFGRYFTSHIRGDITWDYRFESDARGTVQANCCNGEREFGISSHVLLANLYYNFNRRGRINPYIGIGLGTTYNETSENTKPGDCGCTVSIASGDSWHVAGAFMAGVSMKLRKRLTFDMGYRFLYLGDVRTGRLTQVGNGSHVATHVSAEDLHAHELRLGQRYDIR